MTPEMKELIVGFLVTDQVYPWTHQEEFLRAVGVEDGHALGLSLLKDATDQRDADGVELALAVCEWFGLTHEHVDPLRRLAFEDFHTRHKDIADSFRDLQDLRAVDALMHLVEHVPPAFEDDDERPVSRAALFALGRLAGDLPKQVVTAYANSPDPVIRRWALEQQTIAERR